MNNLVKVPIKHQVGRSIEITLSLTLFFILISSFIGKNY